MTPSNRVCVHATWPEVAQVLGLPATGQALPLQSACPLCRGDRLTVYQDSITQGEWGYCFDCRFSGDLFELAAATWQVEIPEAIRRLAYEGVPIPPESLSDQAISVYINRILQLSRRLRKIWDHAKQQLVRPQSLKIKFLRQKFGLADNFSQERELSGPATLFGVSNAVLLERYLFPHKDGHRGSPRMFRGHGWRDLIVVPYFGAPGHIVALFMIGKDGGDAERVMHVFRSWSSSREAGLAGLEAVVEHPSPFVVGTPNALLMLRQQMRHFNQSLRPLPMVAWYDGIEGRTGSAWAALGNKNIVIWNNKLDLSTLIQCRKTDGRLVLAGPTTKQAMAHFLRQQQPMDLVKKLHKDSKPWERAVRDWLEKAKESDVQSLVQQIVERGENPKDFCLGESATSLKKRAVVAPSRTVKVHGRVFTERNNRWYDRQDRMVLNATIRINKVVLRRLPEYVGTLTIGGKEIHFRHVLTKDRDRLDLRFYSDLAMRHNQKLFWSRNDLPATSIAIALQEPEIVKGRSKIGWDGRSFQFRHFCLRHGQARTNDDWLFPADCPGPQLTSFRLGPHIKEQLSKGGPEAEWAWATTISLASAVIAPAMALRGPQTLLLDKGVASAAKLLLDRYGVPVRRLHRMSMDFRSYHPIVWKHRWPVCLAQGDRVFYQAFHNWLLSSGFAGLIHIANPLSAELLIRNGGFVGVDVPKGFRGHLIADIPVEHALLAYLRRLTKLPRSPAHGTSGEASWGQVRICCADAHDEQLRSLWLTIQADMAGWLEEQGGNSSAILSSSRLARFANDDGAVEKLAIQLYASKYIRTAGKPMVRSVLVPLEERGLVLTKEQIISAVIKAKLPAPDLSDVQEPIIIPVEKLLP